MTIPAYLQIKNHILENIHNGQWKEGAYIPAEVALSRKFGVSRMTVNRAIKELEKERVLERRQGAGTIITQQKFNMMLVEIRNIADDIRAKGHDYHAQVVKQATRPLPSLLINTFPDCRNQNIYQVDIIHFDNNKPIQYEQRWVNPTLAPNFIEQDFTKVNTSEWLIKHVPLERGEYTVEALIMPSLISKRLGVNLSIPALVLHRWTYSQGKMASHAILWHPGDRYQFSGVL